LQSDEQWAKIIRSGVIRDDRCIKHHLFSSIWSGPKSEFQVIKDNCSWLVGDGKHISFWLDSWCGQILAQTYNLSDQMIQLLPKKLESYT